MNTFIKFVFYIGFLFFGGGFLIAFCQFVAYNGLGNFFDYVPSEKSIVKVNLDHMPRQLIYEYSVNGKVFTGSQNVSEKIAIQVDLETVAILYNKTFNSFSMIKGIDGKSSKVWDQTIGMIVFGFFFLFIFLIYKFADMNKWIGVYTRGEFKSSETK